MFRKLKKLDIIGSKNPITVQLFQIAKIRIPPKPNDKTNPDRFPPEPKNKPIEKPPGQQKIKIIRDNKSKAWSQIQSTIGHVCHFDRN